MVVWYTKKEEKQGYRYLNFYQMVAHGKTMLDDGWSVAMPKNTIVIGASLA